MTKLTVMRSLRCMAAGLLALAGACGGGGGGGNGNKADAGLPVLIAGGGAGGDTIAGSLTVFVIDAVTDEQLANANVLVSVPGGEPLSGGAPGGRADFTVESLAGPVDITVSYGGYIPVTWYGVTTSSVTIPLQPQSVAPPATANMTGTINGWDSLPDPDFGRALVAYVLYSFVPELDSPENNLIQAEGANNLPVNTCVKTFGFASCNWQLKTRAGKQALLAIIVDAATDGTDVHLFGYALKRGIDLAANQTLTNEALELIAAADLKDITVQFQGVPGGLPQVVGIPFIDIGDEGWLILAYPGYSTTVTTIKLPVLSGALADGRLGLVARATENATTGNPSSTQILHDVGTGGALTVADWLAPAEGLMASSSGFSFSPVSGAAVSTVDILDASNKVVWNLAIFDGTTLEDLPALSPDPIPGTARLRVSAVGVDGFDPSHFALDDLQGRSLRSSTSANVDFIQ